MLKRFILMVFIIVCSLGLFIQDVQAKRFGGGRSFGVTRSVSSSSRAASNFATKQGGMASKWLGPLAGLAMGGLLASLFMGNGFGTGILTWLMIAGLALLVVSVIRQFKQRAQMPYSNYQSYRDNSPEFIPAANTASFNSPRYPQGFDEQTFLRDVKAQFIRLQAAYDQQDLNDLRAFTTPEVFAEIRLQLQERGNAANQTDVVELNAQLIDATYSEASVQFSGSIRENHAQAESFTETWHFNKDSNSERWIVAGIEQK